MDLSINRFRKDSRAEKSVDCNLGYYNPCVGLYYYKNCYRYLFKFEYVPRGQEFAPEYVYCNGRKHYVIGDGAQVFSHVE